MITTTLYLAAAAETSCDPWRVLGTSYADRVAIAALADLTLARRLQVAPAADDESAAARRLHPVPGPPLGEPLDTAAALLGAADRNLDVDRAVRLLRDLAPVIEQHLLATGALAEAGQKGLLRKRTVVAPRPEAVAAARSAVAAAAQRPDAPSRTLALLATVGLPDRRAAILHGGARPTRPDPFDDLAPSAPNSDGAPLGDNAADLLTALVTVLAGTTDHTGAFE